MFTHVEVLYGDESGRNQLIAELVEHLELALKGIIYQSTSWHIDGK